MALACVILAAGQGSRMLSDRPKVLHRLAGVPLIAHVVQTAEALDPDRIIVVIGEGGEAVKQAVSEFCPRAEFAHQSVRLGTAHAVAQAGPLLSDFTGDVVVLYGDTPFIRPETIAAMRSARAQHAVVILAFEAADPGSYGRVILSGETVERIVEAADATETERALRLCNAGVMCADAQVLFRLLAKVEPTNIAQEYYLTEVVRLAREEGLSVGAISCAEDETLGINTRAELARAEASFQARARAEAFARGVTLVAPETVFFALDTEIGRDALIEPYVVFGPGVTVETGAEIRAFCHLEGCHIAAGAVVGPFARLRPGAEIGPDARVGNFVEIKEAILGEGAKVNHLSYIGDAEVGAFANIGAGSVTCNYDGVAKHRTVIGPKAFIGSDTMLVAPVTVGAEAVVGSGSVITEDVPAGALALGRARQVTKPGSGRALMAKKQQAKAASSTEREG